MKMIQIKSKEQIIKFHQFPKRLNKDNQNYIVPLEKDIEQIFDRSKNKNFNHGVCERWLCINKEGKVIGKIAAFINKKYKQKQPTGGIGFFDCINDKMVSRFMFKHCENWLANQGMQAMDGPINFGERDKYWGLLIEGFEPPLYGMNYNPEYYEELFKDYGFEVYFNQMCYSRPINGPLSENFIKGHAKIEQLGTIRLETFQKNNLEKQAEDFTEIYNHAWASHGQGKYLDKRVAKKMFMTMKPIINENISFLVYENEKPIAMWINIPDLNHWFKYLDGKFGWFEKLKFLWIKTTKPNPNMVGLVFGIVPEWQKKGIDGYMICEGVKLIRSKTKFEKSEMQWIGDFNPKMINLAKSLETKVTRKLATYRYLFDENKPFERHPYLN